jgi:ribonuclease HI
MTNNLAEYQGLVSALHYLTNQQSEVTKRL